MVLRSESSRRNSTGKLWFLYDKWQPWLMNNAVSLRPKSPSSNSSVECRKVSLAVSVVHPFGSITFSALSVRARNPAATTWLQESKVSGFLTSATSVILIFVSLRWLYEELGERPPHPSLDKRTQGNYDLMTLRGGDFLTHLYSSPSDRRDFKLFQTI